MNKQIMPIILGIFLLVSVSAMYAGESKNYSLSELGLTIITDVSISNNLSEIFYSFTNESARITIPYNAPPQDFIITFNELKENIPVVVTTSSGGGGGGSHKKKINNTTNLTNTSHIIVEEFNYTPPIEKPVEVIPEVKSVEPIVNETIVDKGGNKMDMNTWKWIIMGIVIFLIILVIILSISYKKKKASTEVYTEEEMNKEIEDINKKLSELPKEDLTKVEEEKNE